MKFGCHKPGYEARSRIATDYFLYSEKVSGKSPIRSLSLKCLSSGYLWSTLISQIDKNYEYASNQVDDIYGNFCRLFIALYGDNDNLIAHTSMEATFNEDCEEVVNVGPILIKNKESIVSKDGISWTQGIYRLFVKEVETLVSSHFQAAAKINLHSTMDDGEFWNLCDYMGYEIDDCPDLQGNEIRFTKLVREKGKAYERSNPNQ